MFLKINKISNEKFDELIFLFSYLTTQSYLRFKNVTSFFKIKENAFILFFFVITRNKLEKLYP